MTTPATPDHRHAVSVRRDSERAFQASIRADVRARFNEAIAESHAALAAHTALGGLTDLVIAAGAPYDHPWLDALADARFSALERASDAADVYMPLLGKLNPDA